MIPPLNNSPFVTERGLLFAPIFHYTGGGVTARLILGTSKEPGAGQPHRCLHPSRAAGFPAVFFLLKTPEFVGVTMMCDK